MCEHGVRVSARVFMKRCDRPVGSKSFSSLFAFWPAVLLWVNQIRLVEHNVGYSTVHPMKSCSDSQEQLPRRCRCLSATDYIQRL